MHFELGFWLNLILWPLWGSIPPSLLRDWWNCVKEYPSSYRSIVLTRLPWTVTFIIPFGFLWSRDSVVGVATRLAWTAQDESYLSAPMARPALRPTQPTLEWVPENQRAVCLTDHLHLAPPPPQKKSDVPIQAMKSYRKSCGIATLIRKLSTR
jgi:hypothetical protein